MDEARRTANLLGAAALSIADRTQAAAADAVGVSVSGSAALVTLQSYPGLGVSELGARVGLSQPAAARMLDSLAAHDLIERHRADGRSVAVRLTRGGHAAARRVLRERQRELDRLVQRLGIGDRESLTQCLERLLDGLYDDVGSEHVVCRLCNRDACLAEGARCPVGHAARERGPARR